MRHPAYHLRPNKAVDRLTLIEVLRRLANRWDLADYTYYGLGGPFLEDFRLLREFFPQVRQVCIERDEHTYRRQEFHRPARHIRLVKSDFGGFLTEFHGGPRAVFWLDYTDLRYERFDEFMDVLGKVGNGSVVKLTLRAVAPRG